MTESPISKKLIFYSLILSATIMMIMFLIYLLDSKTTVVFCYVGQGDATYMRIRNQYDVLIDAGPDNAVLSCLGKYMPFFDRTIELAFITHPQKDHYGGFLSIFDRYKVKTLMLTQIHSSNESYQTLLHKAQSQNTSVIFPLKGDIMNIYDTVFEFIWPEKSFLEANSHTRFKFSSKEYSLRDTTSDPNLFSLVFRFTYGKEHILFTGDATQEILSKMLENSAIKTTILKMPHHGSSNGLNLDFLRLAEPSLTVISVGKKNRYNHPSPSILKMLKDNNTPYLRTDKNGNIALFLERNGFKMNGKYQ